MKKLVSILLALCLLAASTSALAAVNATVIASSISTRSGPSTRYTEPGTFLSYGSQVKVHTKVWDNSNGIYWVQVEFSTGRTTYRAYTGDWRLNANLSSVPEESVIGYTWVLSDTHGYAGPGSNYYYYSSIRLPRNSYCAIMEVENNFALLECENSSQGLTRVWVPLSAIWNGDSYIGQDTYTDYSGWYGDDWYGDDDGATLIPGDSGWSGNNGYNSYIDPMGRYVTIHVQEGNARSGPGTGYSFLNYVRKGEVYQVLDWEMGNTGKDWYQIRVNGRLCWISSGLVNINGYTNGTAYGYPIPDESDPLDDYPQTSTYLIGRMCYVTSVSANVRELPDTSSASIGIVTQYRCYEILDCRIGSTGKAWYQIDFNGELGWISSGVATLI